MEKAPEYQELFRFRGYTYIFFNLLLTLTLVSYFMMELIYEGRRDIEN